MGGYAAFVWPAFGFAALVLIGLLAQSWWSGRQRAAELDQLRSLARPRAASRPRLRPSSPESERPAEAGNRAGGRA
jgi:heme exporter protein D